MKIFPQKNSLSAVYLAFFVSALALSFYLVFDYASAQSQPPKRVVLTSGTTWTVPADWVDANSTIEVIGGGAGGAGSGGLGGGGGGAGAYARITNADLTPSGSVTYAVGAGGAATAAGTDTYFCRTTTNCASIAGTAVMVGADNGLAASGITGGAGGTTANSSGTIEYAGGSGGNGDSTGDSGGGGGGAAGPAGAGKNGGLGSNATTNGGGGGGGCGGGSSAAGSAGGTSGGNGGAGPGGTGGGTGGTGAIGGNGSLGGGGGGGDGSAAGRAGGKGGATLYCGGGGGGAADDENTGGEAGMFGGGGGGGEGAGGPGSQGVIIITYYCSANCVSASTIIGEGATFAGDLNIVGALAKGAGTFVIDHPLDPENKLLYHSFVESPDVKNIYDGLATLDSKGEVTIKLPDYFEALNNNYRYQYSPYGQPAPGLYIKQEIEDNQFVIAGGPPNARISWQVTGIRKDPYILANPIIPEVDKGPEELLDVGEFIFEGYE